MTIFFKKGLSFGTVLAMISIIFGVMVFTTPTSSAASVSSSHDWIGYDGNQTIYLTTGVNSSNDLYLSPTNNSWSVQLAASNGPLETNGVALGIGGTLTSSNDQGQAFRESYESGPNGGPGIMHIYVPVSAVGASNWTYTTGGTTYDYSSIDYEKFSVDTPSTFPTVQTLLNTNYDSGTNRY